MSGNVRVPLTINLEYYEGDDDETGMPERWLVDPPFTNELSVAVYPDENDSVGVPPELTRLGRLQVQLAGTPRALEALGTYLIALARLQTMDPNVHDHFEDVQNEAGGTAHVIVRRKAP